MAQLPQTSLIATACVDFNETPTITILPENYSGDDVQTPSILPITITRPEDAIEPPFGIGIFTVIIGSFSPYILSVTQLQNPISSLGVLAQTSADYSATITTQNTGPSDPFVIPFALSNTITFHKS